MSDGCTLKITNNQVCEQITINRKKSGGEVQNWSLNLMYTTMTLVRVVC